MSGQDSLMVRSIMRDIGKHPIDVSDLRVSVNAGVVYLQGRVKPIRGYHEDTDMDEVMTTLCKCIRQHPGIRDIVMDVQTPNRDRLNIAKKKNIVV
jgi:hypothetical protein